MNLIHKYLYCLLVLLLPTIAMADNAQQQWATSYALEANGQYEQAAALMVPQMDHGKASEYALLRYGWLNYLQGNYNDAIRAYKRALERNNRSIDARLAISLPLLAQKRWREASRYLNQVLAQSPFDYTAHIRLMICEEGQRKWETLATHAKNIAAYYPIDATALVYLARAYAWQGKRKKAGDVYARVLIRFPTHVEAMRFLKTPAE